VRERWTVGELWGVLHEYAQQRRDPHGMDDLFQWLLPPQPGPTPVGEHQGP
jgi:hypothetical protein